MSIALRRPQQMRIKQLDLLRGLAILLVLGRHPVMKPPESGLLGLIGSTWQRFGWTGVDLFFVLSGFLIGGLLFNEFKCSSSLNIWRFLIRRGLRIWPGYLVLLAFMVLFAPLSKADGGAYNFSERLAAFAPHFLHLQNYLGNVQMHTWSLAVEEHFYLLLPGLLFLLFRVATSEAKLFKLMAVTTAVLSVTCVALRLISAPSIPLSDLAARMNPTHLRIDSLFFGVFLSAVYHLKPELFAAIARRRRTLVALSLLLIAPMLIVSIEDSVFVSTWGYTLLYLGYGCLLVWAVSATESKRFFSRGIESIGVYSYGIYLWHWHLAITLVALVPFTSSWNMPAGVRWLLITSVYVFVAVMLGRLMDKIVGLPALRFRDRWFPPAGSAAKHTDRGGPPAWPPLQRVGAES